MANGIPSVHWNTKLYFFINSLFLKIELLRLPEMKVSVKTDTETETVCDKRKYEFKKRE